MIPTSFPALDQGELKKIYHKQMQKICDPQALQRENLLLFSVLFQCEFNIFGFVMSVRQSKTLEDII